MVSELISSSALQLASNWFDSQLLNYALLLFDPKKKKKLCFVAIFFLIFFIFRVNW